MTQSERLSRLRNQNLETIKEIQIDITQRTDG